LRSGEWNTRAVHPFFAHGKMVDTRETEEKQKRYKRTTAGQTQKRQKNNTQEKHRLSRRDTRQIEEKQKRH
jgi:hypothetical protein